jgi:hypothetical protein
VESDGSFTVTLDAAEGEYLVEAVVPGYAVASQKINLASAGSVRLQIQPVGNPKASMIGTNMEAGTGVGSGGGTGEKKKPPVSGAGEHEYVRVRPT